MPEDLHTIANRMNQNLSAPGFIRAWVDDEERRILAVRFTSAKEAEGYKLARETEGTTVAVTISPDAPDTVLQFH
ncbi:MAG TPA: hypothetical protein VFY65_21230 [Longimicrobium sp.]|nr:hypothetical protein [Longimicrobium sp.]